ncbi:MAG TPA: chemotaxis protein CheX [Bryobacteraceae bacterium]|nr:chemotaxis protein CheX [Bryobacteraceae bacterium]
MNETAVQTISEQEIAAAICTAAGDVFSTMLGMDLVAGPMEIGEAASRSRAGVVALLGFAGDWAGSGTVYCDGRFACRMASQLLMAEYGVVNDDVLDAVAEVGNMIIGNVKNTLEQKLGPMGLSTPTVVYGRNFETRTVGSKEWVTVPFESGEFHMGVQITIAPNPRKDRPAQKRVTLSTKPCPYCGSHVE